MNEAERLFLAKFCFLFLAKLGLRLVWKFANVRLETKFSFTFWNKFRLRFETNVVYRFTCCCEFSVSLLVNRNQISNSLQSFEEKKHKSEKIKTKKSKYSFEIQIQGWPKSFLLKFDVFLLHRHNFNVKVRKFACF